MPPSPSPLVLTRILLQERAFASRLFAHSVIYLHPDGLMGSLCCGQLPIIIIIYFIANMVPDLSNLFLCYFDVSPPLFEHFCLFCTMKRSRLIFCCFFPVLESAMSPRSCDSFTGVEHCYLLSEGTGRMNLETRLNSESIPPKPW